MRTSWYLTDLAEARGKQELFTRQSPQKLKVLREHALIESAVSSTASKRGGGQIPRRHAHVWQAGACATATRRKCAAIAMP